MEIRLPFDPHPVILVARVIESKDLEKEKFYDTHLEFLMVDEKHKKIMIETVEYYLRISPA